MEKYGERIGILGGSFDPVHNGHLHMAQSAYEQFHLDKVWLLPNGHAPHKDELRMAEAKHRMAMCELAVQKYAFMETCDIEITSEECSYTYITMQKLNRRYLECDFHFIMGADSLNYFDKWKKPEVIASLCKILVVNRGEFKTEDLNAKIVRIQNLFPADIRVVHCPKIEVSSTEIRHGKKLDKIPPEVRAYIIENHLYGF